VRETERFDWGGDGAYSTLIIGEDEDVHAKDVSGWQGHLWKAGLADRVVRDDGGEPVGYLALWGTLPFTDPTRKDLGLEKAKKGKQPGLAAITVRWATAELREAASTRGSVTITDEGTIVIHGVQKTIRSIANKARTAVAAGGSR
jgi:hypothetical protein